MIARRGREENEMSNADFRGGVKSGVLDAEVKAGAGTEGVSGSLDVALKPEVRDLVSAASGMLLAGLAGPWGPAVLVAAGAGLWLYRKQKAKSTPPGPGTPGR
jgi:hypothetical protein